MQSTFENLLRIWNSANVTLCCVIQLQQERSNDR